MKVEGAPQTSRRLVGHLTRTWNFEKPECEPLREPWSLRMFSRTFSVMMEFHCEASPADLCLTKTTKQTIVLSSVGVGVCERRSHQPCSRAQWSPCPPSTSGPTSSELNVSSTK